MTSASHVNVIILLRAHQSVLKSTPTVAVRDLTMSPGNPIEHRYSAVPLGAIVVTGPRITSLTSNATMPPFLCSNLNAQSQWVSCIANIELSFITRKGDENGAKRSELGGRISGIVSTYTIHNAKIAAIELTNPKRAAQRRRRAFRRKRLPDEGRRCVGGGDFCSAGFTSRVRGMRSAPFDRVSEDARALASIVRELRLCDLPDRRKKSRPLLVKRG